MPPPPAQSSDVTSTFGAHAWPVLDLVDDLHALGLQRDIPIPQVAVMGHQSSGKSSVLEALSGVPFPGGRGLVTRCATQISMGPGKKWEAEIRAGSKGVSVAPLIDNKAEITVQIEKMTNELCGSDTFCADEIIEIKLRAPGQPDLALIDLPGIVRTATTRQDEKIIQQVDSLLNQYLSQPRTVILAVIPAPSDIATVDILERAAKVDSHGNRSVGVLTKPDLVDPGAEAGVFAVLNNVTKPLQNGYLMLKNCSQHETDADLSLEKGRQSEKSWFKNSPFSSRMDVLGVEALTSALTSLLVSHIEDALPTMRQEMESKLDESAKDLKEVGEEAPETALGRRALLGDILRKWSASMRRVCANADYSELESNAEKMQVLRVELSERQTFLASVHSTSTLATLGLVLNGLVY